MQQAAYVLHETSISSLLMTISTRIKLPTSNRIIILQAYNTGFITDAAYKHNILFATRKETDKKTPI